MELVRAGRQNASTGYPCLDGVGRGQDAQALNPANFPSRRTPRRERLRGLINSLNLNTSGLTRPAEQLSCLRGQQRKYGDYYYDCRSGARNPGCSGGFTGVVGTGFGSLSNCPSSCTAGRGGTYYTSPTGSYGVAYFATDANGGKGELYVCTSANTWTGIYQPYTYPHPLETGGSAPPPPPPPPAGPGAPTNLTGVVH